MTAIVATYGELSGQALVAVLVGGAVVVATGVRRGAGRGAEPVRRAGLPWLAWLGAVAAWELMTFLRRDLGATASDLMDPVLAHPGARAAATIAWFAGGYWLITRPGSRPEAT